ncbi:CLC_0170 family protein [Paenibacillus cellulosilyticus]|uniref:CLC_0170 family protein n=1 Tax=Paenibacillus cellulosilyticus TaxID=375489 RepID=UPI003CCC8AF7
MIPLLLFSGLMILRVDRAELKQQKMSKEQKFSTFLGVTNIVLAFSFFVLRMVLF